jgi:hypothetical protein
MIPTPATQIASIGWMNRHLLNPINARAVRAVVEFETRPWAPGILACDVRVLDRLTPLQKRSPNDRGRRRSSDQHGGESTSRYVVSMVRRRYGRAGNVGAGKASGVRTESCSWRALNAIARTASASLNERSAGFRSRSVSRRRLISCRCSESRSTHSLRRARPIYLLQPGLCLPPN